MMNFEEFKDQVAENILGHFPEEFQEAEVRIERRVKNNDTVREGMYIMKVLYIWHSLSLQSMD